MSKQQMVWLALPALVAVTLVATPSPADDSAAEAVTPAQQSDRYVPKSKSELKRMLTPMQYRVTQSEDTEPPFRNEYWDNKRAGIYRCIVCEQPLFSSQTKYESGTGWPSFYKPIEKENVGFREDWKLFYTRIEVHCARCKSHLGHVFDDGPRPTGQRYCMNSASLKFVPADQPEPDQKPAVDNQQAE